MNKSNTSEQSAQPEADSNSTAQNQNVSQPNANTNVVGIPFKTREIKFRLYDKEGKIIGYETHIQNEFGCWQIYQSSLRYDWNDGNENKLVREGYFIAATYKVQYTGLKDKIGKEIYEGDIVQTTNYRNKRKTKSVVRFHADVCESGFHFGSIGWYKEEIEVIGNIFENPELLQTCYNN